MLSSSARPVPRLAGAHTWRTASRHSTEEGETRYQDCRCGLWRILVNGQETWRSSPEPCVEMPADAACYELTR